MRIYDEKSFIWFVSSWSSLLASTSAFELKHISCYEKVSRWQDSINNGREVDIKALDLPSRETRTVSLDGQSDCQFPAKKDKSKIKEGVTHFTPRLQRRYHKMKRSKDLIMKVVDDILMIVKDTSLKNQIINTLT